MDFGKAVGDEEDEDYEKTVGATFNFEISEEGVCTEEIEGFVNNVCLVWVSCQYTLFTK